MPIKFDPKVTGPIPKQIVDRLQKGEKPQEKTDVEKRGYMRAMEKPERLATPDSDRMRPDPGAKKAEALFQKELAQLKAALKADGATKLAGAQQALLFAASYAIRRSKGSRQRGMALCDEVGEEVPEIEALAKKLKKILYAEGLLHDVSAESTLRAARGLIEMLGDDDEDAA